MTMTAGRGRCEAGRRKSTSVDPIPSSRTPQWNWEPRQCSDPEFLEADLGGATADTDARRVEPSGNVPAWPGGRELVHQNDRSACAGRPGSDSLLDG